VPARHTFNPYAAATAPGAPPRLCPGLVLHPGGNGKALVPDSAGDTGSPNGLPVSGSWVTESAIVNARLGGGAASTAVTVPRIGAHLTGGRRR
jgi:hypothetical protein